MRLLAAWLVIYGHAHAITGIPGNDGIAWLTQLRAAGPVAVDMFFSVSGFLIAASLQRNSVRGYLVSRGLRILPALVVCMALTTLLLVLPAGKSVAGNIAIASIIASVCAALSWWLVERPALRLKKRWVAGAPEAWSVGAQG